jgi:CheY-like chemotaxis protein
MIQSQTVLVVEDQVEMRGMMVRVLAGEGFRVLEAGDGQQALKEFAIHQVDLIVTDIVMPRMDGFELATEVRKRSKTPILFTTGYMQHHQDPPSTCLMKPFTPSALTSEVRRALASSLPAA